MELRRIGPDSLSSGGRGIWSKRQYRLPLQPSVFSDAEMFEIYNRVRIAAGGEGPNNVDLMHRQVNIRETNFPPNHNQF